MQRPAVAVRTDRVAHSFVNPAGAVTPPAPKNAPPAVAQRAVYEDPVNPWAEPRAWRSEEHDSAPVAQAARLSAGLETLVPALNGYCPVQLIEKEAWLPGDSRWPVTHEGRTYLCGGPEQQKRFLANPERYTPVLSGNDPVLATDEHRNVPGQPDFCVAYDGRLYMFSGTASLTRFRQNPKRYAAALR